VKENEVEAGLQEEQEEASVVRSRTGNLGNHPDLWGGRGRFVHFNGIHRAGAAIPHHCGHLTYFGVRRPGIDSRWWYNRFQETGRHSSRVHELNLHVQDFYGTSSGNGVEQWLHVVNITRAQNTFSC
jgi:hypothetical protein